MSFLNSILKVSVGDKSKQDVKAIMPLVEKIKSFESQIEKLTHDELRAKTVEFKARIAEVRATVEDKIAVLQEEADTTENIDRKEDIYQEILPQIQSLIEKIENSIILIRNSKELAGRFKNG